MNYKLVAKILGMRAYAKLPDAAKFALEIPKLMAAQTASWRYKSPVARYDNVEQITAATNTVTWTSDPWYGWLDIVKHPTFFQEAINEHPGYADDCLPEGTLLLTSDFEFVPIEKIKPGMKIWGRDKWTEVKAAWYKGILPVDVITLNNGSSFRCTSDHKVYEAKCPHNHRTDEIASKCPCRLPERDVIRKKAGELKKGDVLCTPDKISYGTNFIDPKKSLIEGYYISDGWISHPGDFYISGQDGCPKEEQKREIETICKEFGIPTKWYRKSICVKNKEWAQRIAEMGHRSIEKHALSINLQEDSALALYNGILSDSDRYSEHGKRNICTFTTTSKELFLQTRILAKMQGFSCGAAYIPDRGGLGKNPIWRLYIRSGKVSGKKLLRVRSIDKNLYSAPVWDIETEDHYVYLPEADVTVSNCDGYAGYWCVSLLKNHLVDECYYATAAWTELADVGCHAVCVYRKGSDWWWVSNWHKCVPQPCKSKTDWVSQIESKKSNILMVTMWPAHADSRDFLLLEPPKTLKS